MTNIIEEHRRAFEALTSGRHENFSLFSCFVGGTPAAAIVAVTRKVRLSTHTSDAVYCALPARRRPLRGQERPRAALDGTPPAASRSRPRGAFQRLARPDPRRPPRLRR